MRSNIFVEVTAVERARLEALVSDPQAAQQHVWRARIVLLTADGLGTMEIMRRTGKSTPTVWRRQARFMEERVDGLFYDKTRPPGTRPLAPKVVRRVVELIQIIRRVSDLTPLCLGHYLRRTMHYVI